MSEKNKKGKHKLKSNDDLINVKTDKKPLFNDNNSDSVITESESNQKKEKAIHLRKRKNTKISHKSKDNQTNNQILRDSLNGKGKKVKFSKIDVVDVESWKKLNLKMTAEENLDELLKITEGKKGKMKNINCDCLIF